MRPINILYIAPSSGFGGVETFLKHCAQAHTDEFKPIFLLFRGGPLKEQLEQLNKTTYQCSTPPKISRPWTWVSFLFFLFKIISKEKIHIVHSSMSYAALFTWPSWLIAKHTWFQHGPVSGWMDRWAYGLPHSKIYYNSQYTLNEQLRLVTKTSTLKNEILSLGTPLVDISNKNKYKTDLQASYNLSPDTIILVMACRLQRWKGVHIAIEAFKELHSISQKPLSFFIYGDASWDPQYAQQLHIQAKGLPVYIKEPVKDISPVFLAADIVINASTTPEPFGLTIIEAMSCAAIPIAGNQGGPLEILKELPDCLYQANNPKSLEQTLHKLTHDDAQRAAIRNKISDVYNRNYTLQKMIQRLEKSYKYLLE